MRMNAERMIGRYSEIPKEILNQIVFDQTITGSTNIRIKRMAICEDIIRESSSDMSACKEIVSLQKELNHLIAEAEKLNGRTKEEKLQKRIAYDRIRSVEKELHTMRSEHCTHCAHNDKSSNTRINLTRHGSRRESISRIKVLLALYMLVYSNANKDRTEEDISKHAISTPVHISRIQELTHLSDSSIRAALKYWHDEGYIRRYYGLDVPGVYHIRFAFDVDQKKYKSHTEGGSGYIAIPNSLLSIALNIDEVVLLRLFLALLLNVDDYLYNAVKANRYEELACDNLKIQVPFVKYIQRSSHSSMGQLKERFVKLFNQLAGDIGSIKLDGDILTWPAVFSTPQNYEVHNNLLRKEELSRNLTEETLDIIDKVDLTLFGAPHSYGTYFANDSMARLLLSSNAYIPGSEYLKLPNLDAPIRNVVNHLGIVHLTDALTSTFLTMKDKICLILGGESYATQTLYEKKVNGLIDEMSAMMSFAARESKFAFTRSRVCI